MAVQFKKERDTFQAALEPLSPWCVQTAPILSQVPLEYVQALTDQVIAEITGFYHQLTELKGSPPSAPVQYLNATL